MFDGWRRKISLDQVQSRSRVKLQARVVSPNVVKSPLTGLSAAALEWLFYVRSVNHSFGQARYPLHDVRQLYHPIGSRRLGEKLMLESEGKLIQVSLREAVLRFPHAQASNALVYRDLSPDFSNLIDNPAPRQGPLAYHELALSEGDHVTLTATIQPLPPERSDPYRSSVETAQSRPDFSTHRGLGPIVIEERNG